MPNGFSDFGMCNRLYQAMKARDPRASVESLPLLMELDVTYSIIQSMDMLISYKLHPSLAALRAGKPVFAFSKMNKVRSLLRQFGLEEYVCSYLEPEELYWPRIEVFLEHGQAKAQAALPRIRQAERESVRQLHRLKVDIEQQCRQHRRFWQLSEHDIVERRKQRCGSGSGAAGLTARFVIWRKKWRNWLME